MISPGGSRSGPGPGSRLRLPAALAALALLLAALAAACGGGNGGGSTPDNSGDTPAATGAAESQTPSANAGLLTPTDHTPISRDELNRERTSGIQGQFSGQRLVIPSLGVDAPVSAVAVPADGQMPNPSGPEEVVWYDFTAWAGLGGIPGVGGNSVFSGHVDYHNYGPAVFWRLRELSEGDTIEVQMQDGTSYRYQVQWNRAVDPNDSIWNDIVASTAQESVTLITCGGTWDGERREYDHRQVVWAVRVS